MSDSANIIVLLVDTGREVNILCNPLNVRSIHVCEIYCMHVHLHACTGSSLDEGRNVIIH